MHRCVLCMGRKKRWLTIMRRKHVPTEVPPLKRRIAVIELEAVILLYSAIFRLLNDHASLLPVKVPAYQISCVRQSNGMDRVQVCVLNNYLQRKLQRSQVIKGQKPHPFPLPTRGSDKNYVTYMCMYSEDGRIMLRISHFRPSLELQNAVKRGASGSASLTNSSRLCRAGKASARR